MPRKSQVRYWKSRKGGGYFTTVKGEQIELALGPDDEKDNGPVYRAAVRKWVDLEMGTAGSDQLTFRELYNRYRDHPHQKGQERYRRNGLLLLKTFLEAAGETPVTRLSPEDVSRWLGGRTHWKGGTRAAAAKWVSIVLNWGVKARAIKANPLKGSLDHPEAARRGAEARMSHEIMGLIESELSTAQARLFFGMLRHTGARPIEIREATHGRYFEGWITHPWRTDGYVWKNAVKLKKDRVIFVPDRLRAEVDALHDPRRKGPLFLTRFGVKWKPANQAAIWDRVLARPKVLEYLGDNGLDRAHLTPMSYRHTFMSDWVDSGRSLHVCAEICGTSVRMIERHYGHADPRRMEAFYRDFLAAR